MRIPAGVRIGGRSVGGRFVAVEMLPILAQETDDVGRSLLLDVAARELDTVTQRVERLTKQYLDDPKRYARRLVDAEDRQAFWQSTADGIVSKLTRGVRRKRKRPPAPPIEVPPAPPPPTEPEETEWEFGLSYGATAAASSDVDINFRMARIDGRPFGETEAARVMADFRANLSRGAGHPVPAGYKMAGISWRSPNIRTSWKDSRNTMRDFESFRDVLYIASDQPIWRLGGVD